MREVLISVYSPNMMKSKSIADRLTPLPSNAAKKYLGGKLPVDKYAFIHYFQRGEQRIQMTYAGARGIYSSFLPMPELPESYLLNPVD